MEVKSTLPSDSHGHEMEMAEDHSQTVSFLPVKEDGLLEALPPHQLDNVLNPSFCHELISCVMKVRRCAQCGTTQTPQWRNGPRGPRTLCNACGIRLHRRLNKSKLGSTPRRRKKVTRVTRPSPPASFSIPLSHYLKREASRRGKLDHDSLNNAHDMDYVILDRPGRRKASCVVSSLSHVTRARSRRLAEKKSSLHGARSFRCEDFTAAIDLMSLSKERYRMIGKSLDKLQDRYECLKSEVGVSDQDLLAVSGALPLSSGPDFKRIQSELVTAQWEVQAAEIGTQTVAEILAECSEETARKRTKYWEARSELESLILKHFKATTQP